ncbi:capsular polysaccharide export protein, LipB/KpsS family [Marinobacter sp. MBR-105]|jgi:capsular polysaccharide export protein
MSHNGTKANCWREFLVQHGLQHRLVYAIGFNPHWRKTLARFTQGSDITHVRTADQVPEGALALIWGQRQVEIQHKETVLVRLEDGFLRSVGLGAEFARPLSWVADFQHLYFDATGPSRLETLLNEQSVTEVEKSRAKALIEGITAARVSKYNSQTASWARQGKEHVILVPGQVETDSSIAFGAPGIKTNMELLQTVRQQNPQAWVVYKPHPDVVAGARKQGDQEQNALQWCDEIVTHANIAELLEQVDEVHTLTSLAGFEALLRHKSVTCYGLPFYAGWGLTNDQYTCHRRKRTLSLEELAHAVLIQYPLYSSLNHHGFITPEQALKELQSQKTRRQGPGRRLGKYARKAINLIRGAQ